MALGIDYSAGRPDPQEIKKQGYELVCRYLSRSDWKVIDAAERDALLNAGLDIVLVFEDGEGNALKGAAQGVSDGEFAAAQAKKLDAPKGMVLYFAVDIDTQNHAAVAAYLDAAKAAVAPYRVGVYGSFDVCRHALRGGHAVRAWQTAAWSNGRVLPGAALYQRAGTVTVGGTQCDVDEVRSRYHGSWRNALPAGHQGGTAATVPSVAVPLPKLRRGAKGQPVRSLQTLLNQHRDSIPALRALPALEEDGDFGDRTEAAVNAFKNAHGLARPGIVGKLMWRTLIER